MVDDSFDGLTTLCLPIGDVCGAPQRARVDAIGIDFQHCEILDAILYLEKATFVTGEILHVDGGAAVGRW
jgi:NAD(P)-dependent dehydrogenase (short-subunit alcohol dehydrogenase family)